MNTVLKTLGGALLVFILTGCMPPQGERADVIHEDAHSSGSALAISPDSKILASGGKGGWLRLWRLDGGSELASWHAHDRTVNGIHFIRGGRRLISGGFNGMIAEWDLKGRLKREWQTPSPIISIAADAKKNLLLTGHGDGQARLWRLSTSELLHTWKIYNGYIKTVALDAARGRFAASSHDGELAYWKVDVEPRYFDPSGYSTATLEFSPDGNYLYGAGWFSLYRWSLDSGALESLKTEHFGRINRIAFMPDGRHLASISRQTDSAVLILDAASGKTVRRFQKHDLCGAVVTVSPDGRYMATTSDDASVRIWDLERAKVASKKEK